MDNKELAEFKKWENERRQEEIDKYGAELSKINKERASKKAKKSARTLKRIGYLLKSLTIIIFTITAIAILLYLYVMYSGLNSSSNINAKKVIESQYKIDIKILKEETDKKGGNGKYYMQSKTEPKINFTAIKHYGGLKEDYLKRLHKYYFDLWNSNNKKYFTVEETIEDDILNYEIYIDKSNNVEDAGSKIIEFAKFCKGDYRAYCNVYIKVGEERIYPYSGSSITHEQALLNSKGM